MISDCRTVSDFLTAGPVRDSQSLFITETDGTGGGLLAQVASDVRTAKHLNVTFLSFLFDLHLQSDVPEYPTHTRTCAPPED